MSKSKSHTKTVSSKVMNEYMMNTLQSSWEFSARLEKRSNTSGQLFLTLFTALAGGGVVVVTAKLDEILMFKILTLDLGAIAGFGILTYVWVLASVVQQLQEGFLQFFLHKYFRDIDPAAFEKYGLSELLTFYRKVYDKNYKGPAQTAAFFSLLTLGIFNSFLLGCAAYTGWRVCNTIENIPFAFLIGIVSLVGMVIIWLIARKKIERDRATGLKIIKKHHSNQIVP